MNETIKAVIMLLLSAAVGWVGMWSLKQFLVGDIIKLLKEIKDILKEPK